MTFRSAAAAAALAAVLSGGTALAQSDPLAPARQMSANQLGLMEFCQAQGYADADAVSASRNSLNRMPPAPAGSPSTDAMEVLGRGGTLSANGTQTTLASLASSRNTSVGAMCGQMANVAKQAAAMAASMPAMPAMPSIPGGMPAMPGGMPAIPGMPGVPSAAPR